MCVVFYLQSERELQILELQEIQHFGNYSNREETYTVEQLNQPEIGMVKYLISGAKEETRENRIFKLNA